MSELANTLRTAREAKGLTISQVSEKTHVMSCVLDGLEHDDFSRIPAPIYGRGFIKLYCEAVGIEDPRPLVDAFMRLFNGVPEPISEPVPPPAPIAVPPPATAEPPSPTVDAPVRAEESTLPEPLDIPPPKPSPLEPPPVASETDFHLEADTVPPPRAFDEISEQPAAPALAPGANELSGEPPSLSRYASPIRELTRPSIPPVVWRMAVLAALATVLLWVAWLGVSALYRVTSARTTDRPIAASETAPTPVAASPAAKPKPVAAAPKKTADTPKPAASAPKTATTVRRTPQKVAPLYMD